MPHGRKIAVIGLGYVRLPVAIAFAKSGVPVVSFDVNAVRFAELKAGHDRTRQVAPKDLSQPTLDYSNDPAKLKAADFHIVAVPTSVRQRDAGPGVAPDAMIVRPAMRDGIRRGGSLAFQPFAGAAAEIQDACDAAHDRVRLDETISQPART